MNCVGDRTWQTWRAILGKKPETPFIFCPCESGKAFGECHGKE